jgi:hypothetical protein
MGCAAVGVEVGRSVVTFDDGHGATGSEQPVEHHQRLNGPRQMLQDETDEDVVKGSGSEGQGEDVCLPELYIGESCRIRRPLGFCERVRGDID